MKPWPRWFACGVTVLLFARAVAAAATPSVAIDFSYAGYGGDSAPLPTVPAVLRVQATGADDTAMLQAAIARVAALPMRPDGFRGAIELAAGKFQVSGQILLNAEGIVLRGSNDAAKPTTIVATGQSRRTLVQIGGDVVTAAGKSQRVVDDVAPAGAFELTLDAIGDLQVGDPVLIRRPTSKEWVAALGMDKFENQGAFTDLRLNWLPGSRDLVWDRTISKIEAERNRVTLDAPITTALEQRYGAGTVAKANHAPLRHVGLEHLVLESDYATPNLRDEEHAWIAVALEHVEDAWVNHVTARHFASSAVRVGSRARRVTVSACRSEQPISEAGGYRRQSFLVEGQQVLVRDCTAERGMNDFAVGLCAGGPNVFLNCRATTALGPSGAFESWASGVLYENVSIDGAGLKLTRDNSRSQGGGWNAANSVAWNCTATSIEVSGPDAAPNLAVTAPTSLFETQLAKRSLRAGASTASQSPAMNAPDTVPLFAWSKSTAAEVPRPRHEIAIKGGRFVADGKVVWGGWVNGAWWKGQVSPDIATGSGVSITRFVPGRIGPGLTEDLPQLANRMVRDGLFFYQSGPGLWYDRRRDDHQVIARADANVWAPFYELPWARSGEGKAWDGLSRYDVAKYNPWFFSRTREFAQLCDEQGRLLFHNLYNTHNLLETQAHWVDFPWRPANCLNEVGLPEPPPVEERNTIHVANVFYNVEHPARRALHRAYIFHTLDQLGEASNVVIGLGFQFAGPLAFQQFFLDTVAEWEQRNGRHVRVVLNTSKDITDAILADPVRSRQIAVIDLRYWQRQSDGKLWAPRGDVNLAFREQNTVLFGKGVDTPPDTTPLNVYRGVREYCDRFPDRAIVAWHGGAGPIPILMAGGAHALLKNPAAGQTQGVEAEAVLFDRFVRSELGEALTQMTPRDGWLADAENNWCLADDEHVLIYSLGTAAIKLLQDLPHRGYEGVWFNPRTGEMQQVAVPQFGSGATVEKPTGQDWLLSLHAVK
jgi:hypothetical protein